MMDFKNTSSPPLSRDSLQKCFDGLKAMQSDKGMRLIEFPEDPVYIRPVWISEEDFLGFMGLVVKK